MIDSTSTANPFEVFQCFIRGAVPRVAGQHPGRPGELLARCASGFQETFDCGGGVREIATPHMRGCVAVYLPRNGGIENDDGHTSGERLERRQTKTLVLGKKNEYRRAGVMVAQLRMWEIAADLDLGADIVGGRRSLEILPGPCSIGADDDETSLRPRRARFCKGGYQVGQIAAIQQCADKQHEF